MATEVSSIVHRTVGIESGGDELTAPITRDLLGGSFKLPETQELDLDLQSGKVYMQRSKPELQDLNNPPSKKSLMSLFGESSLDLKLVSSNYQSVCTLDKVKFALERAEREPVRKRPSPSYSSSPSSMKETREDESDERLTMSPVAAGCPGCLLYVLVSKNDPKCPRCDSIVPMPMLKKPRIDLNMTI